METERGRRPGVISRVVTWLRAGYPEGVPTGDYVALLGVLRRRLREEEIEEIVERLAAQRSLALTPERIRELIREYSLQEPHEEDIARVSSLLASTGYPVDDEEEEQLEGGQEPAGAELEQTDEPVEPGELEKTDESTEQGETNEQGESGETGEERP